MNAFMMLGPAVAQVVEWDRQSIRKSVNQSIPGSFCTCAKVFLAKIEVSVECVYI